MRRLLPLLLMFLLGAPVAAMAQQPCVVSQDTIDKYVPDSLGEQVFYPEEAPTACTGQDYLAVIQVLLPERFDTTIPGIGQGTITFSEYALESLTGLPTGMKYSLGTDGVNADGKPKWDVKAIKGTTRGAAGCVLVWGNTPDPAGSMQITFTVRARGSFGIIPVNETITETYDISIQASGCTPQPIDGATDTNVVVALSRAEAYLANAALDVYPNPATDAATLRYTLLQPAPVAISLVDLQGRTVRQWAAQPQAPGTHAQALDVADLPQGLYLVRLNAGPAVVTTKLLLTR